MAATTTVTTTVIRPLKVIALICAIISIILLIVAIASDYWLSADGYRQGLWQECFWFDDDTEDFCQNNDDYGKHFEEELPRRNDQLEEDWIYACAALCIIGLIVDVVSTVCIGVGLASGTVATKSRWYKIAMGLMFFAVICVVIALIVFPAMFMQEIDDRQKPEWYFEWAYGLAWGAAIFMFGAAILLLIDRETDELHIEKDTYYSTA